MQLHRLPVGGDQLRPVGLEECPFIAERRKENDFECAPIVEANCEIARVGAAVTGVGPAGSVEPLRPPQPASPWTAVRRITMAGDVFMGVR